MMEILMSNHENLATVAAAAAEGAKKPAPAPEAAKAAQAAVDDKTKANALQEKAKAPDLEAVRREAMQAERTRIAQLDAMALPGCEEILAEAKAEGRTPGETALAIVAHIKATGALDISKQMAASAETVPPLEGGAHDPLAAAAGAAPAKAAGPEAWRAAYAASADLQAEFRDVETFLAFKSAEAAGRARIKH